MAKLLYSAAMSLDGFIAGPDGDMSSLTPYLGPDPALDGLVERIGAPGGRLVRLERVRVTDGPIATSIWLRVIPG
jgi:hypothetical protein